METKYKDGNEEEAEKTSDSIKRKELKTPLKKKLQLPLIILIGSLLTIVIFLILRNRIFFHEVEPPSENKQTMESIDQDNLEPTSKTKQIKESVDQDSEKEKETGDTLRQKNVYEKVNVTTCQEAVDYFMEKNMHNFEFEIEEVSGKDKCKFINNSVGYSFTFDKGWHVFPAGSPSSNAIALQKSNVEDMSSYQLYGINIRSEKISGEEEYNVDNIDNIKITFYGPHPFFNSNRDILEKNVIYTKNGKEIFVVDSTPKNTEKKGNPKDYRRDYLYVEGSELYCFQIVSFDKSFSNQESAETVKIVEHIIEEFQTF